MKSKLSVLKKKLWKLFTLYIKLKHSEDGHTCYCISCGKEIEIGTSNCHGGHYYNKKAYSGLYFNEDNVRPQCYYCNINLGGNTQTYHEALLNEIGIERMNALHHDRHNQFKIDRGEYEDLIEHYKQEIDLLRCGFASKTL